MTANSDFKELLKIFNRESVKYLIVGGYAVIEYTEPRYTKDLDIWVNPDKQNAKRVFRALKAFGAPLSNITVEDFMNKKMVYQMGVPPSRIDILMGLKKLRFEVCWKTRFKANYGSIPTQFLSLPALIVNKRAVGRPQDLIDVNNLRLAESLLTQRTQSLKRGSKNS